ncbi:MAG TPA: ammonium transporter [Armatimonadota bacterium]|nr:ammonium transporter [Armatimonadota bacterium]
MVTVLTVAANVVAWADGPQKDPAGVATGTAANAVTASGPAFSADELKKLNDNAAGPATNGDLMKALDAIGQGHLAINMVWTLLTGFLVMFMQTGFAMVETGFCRGKNAAHVILMNFMIYPLGMLGFWIAGFAIMFGSLAASKIGGPAALGGLPALNGSELSIGGFGIMGLKGFFLNPDVYDVAIYAMFLFQMVFMDTTATIPTGAMAERWRFSAFMIYGFFVSMIVYPIYGHMVWGGGGLAMLGQNFGLGHGAVDFAGSGVVHSVGGFLALAGAIVLGPRLGKYTKDGKPVAIPGHHIPMALVGTFILAFGWFGFNAGSTLGAVGGGNLRISVAATNTMLASAGGALSAILYMFYRYGKYDASMAANGMLAGLVAITAPCAFVTSWSSVVIGLISGVLVCVSVFFVERHGVDDPVGAVSVHGANGIWGLISLGLFADGTYGAGWNGVGASSYLGVAGKGVTGLFYGDPSQLVAQLISAAVAMTWAFGTGYIFFKLQSRFMKLRPTAEEEMEGLDGPEIGVLAYPDFQTLDATSPSSGRRVPSAASLVGASPAEEKKVTA